jgi:hypothetical protein
LTFALGITGHRPNKLPAKASSRAESQLAAVFAAIDAACSAQRDRHAGCYREGPHGVRLFSSFAEGVDQLAVRMRPAHWEVTAVLPFPRDRYEEDFVARDDRGAVLSDHRLEYMATLREAAEIVELADEGDGAPAAYARAGSFTLRQIDLLVAVWDGNEAAGKGGTAHVVAEALAGGVPVVWIATAREQPPWLIERLADVNREAPLADATLGPIAQAVEAALAIAPAPAQRLEDFFEEEVRFPTESSPLVLALGRQGASRGLAEIEREWEDFLARMPEGGRLTARLADLLLARAAVAKALAAQYARAGRNADFLFYLLTLLAIAAALAGGASLAASGASPPGAVLVQAGFALLELVLVGAIVMAVRAAGRQRRRERARDYTVLGEALRHLRFLAPIGECTNRRPGRNPASGTPDWILWYLRATIRELGPPSASLDWKYQEKLLSATEDAEVDRKITRRHEDGKRLRGVQLTLIHLSELCFLATVALLTIFLALCAGWFGLRLAASGSFGAVPQPLASWEERLREFLHAGRPVIILAAALLPAAGAALAAIRRAPGLEREADHAAQAVKLLQGVKVDYAIARDRRELDATATALLNTAKAHAEAIEACGSVYERRRLTLPV